MDEEFEEDSSKRWVPWCGVNDVCVSVAGFKCRCGGLFCSAHRYSDMHECTFDYKEMAQEQIRKNNPVVVGQKVEKI